ncbi:Protein lin-37-like [Exaiptasia diaphana]|nr:Protein lin-37-like [Exaiptasia diaphana]
MKRRLQGNETPSQMSLSFLSKDNGLLVLDQEGSGTSNKAETNVHWEPKIYKKREFSQPKYLNYIMKLFDRNVDFAPFVEDTPLYTLAREWMENKPHRMKLASEMQDFQDSDPLSSSQGSSSSVLAGESVDSSKAVYSLPLPNPKRELKDQTYIPKPLPQPSLSLNIHYFDYWPVPELFESQLLQENMLHLEEQLHLEDKTKDFYPLGN